jgi:hypothetical protein
VLEIVAADTDDLRGACDWHGRTNWCKTL